MPRSDDTHPPDDLLPRFVAGTASRAEGRRIALHLLQGCPSCGQRLRELVRPALPQDAYDAVFARLEASPPRGSGGAPVPADAAATALLAELDAQPTLRQEILARNSRRYLSPGLARLLAERSFEQRYQDPRPMLRSARLAVMIAERLQATSAEEAAQSADLRAYCSSQACHALRITGDLAAAQQAMTSSRAALNQGTGDAVLRAVIYECLGVLRAAQCRREAAIHAYEEAAGIFRDLGRRHDLARVLVGQAVATLYAGDPEGALDLLFEAIPKIEGERDPRLTLAACHAVVISQIDAGQIEDASLKWIELRFLYEQIGDPLLRLREKWLEGKLLIAQGVIRAGIRLLETARTSYRERGMVYDAALIALEIAQGHLRLGRLEHVRALISEILPVFHDLDVDKNVLTAFVHLQRASGGEGKLWSGIAPQES
jgi:tetratricopeptide (TPR) repeat protein